MSKPAAFWNGGPIPEVYSNLIQSGLVSEKYQIPVKKQQLSTEPIKKNVFIPKTKVSSRSISSVRTQSLPPLNEIPKLHTFSTNVQLRPNYKPQPIESIAQNKELMQMRRSESMLTKEKFVSRNEASKIIENYNQLLEQINTDQYDTLNIKEQLEIENKLISANFYSFDDAIKLVKIYNSDVSKLLYRIKVFFQDICHKIPEISLKIDAEKASIVEENKKLHEEIKVLEGKFADEVKEKESIQDILIKTTEKLRSSERNFSVSDNALREAQYNNTEITQKYEEVLLRFNKCAAFRTDLMNQVKDLEFRESENIKHINHQEEIIKKYEKEGAEFKPLYTKAVNEIIELNNQISELKKKPDTKDIGTDVIKPPKQSKKSKKGMKNSTSSTSLHKLSSSSSLSSHSSIKIDENLFNIEIKDIKEIPIEEKPAPKRREKRVNIKAKIAAIEKRHEEEIEAASAVEEEANIEHNNDTNEEEEEAVENEIEEEEVIEETNKNAGQLPPHYTVDFNINNLYMTNNYINKVLSMDVKHAYQVHDTDLNITTAKTEDKDRSFLWTLRQIMFIFKDSFESDSLQKLDASFRSIVYDKILSQYKKAKIVDRIIMDINRAIIIYKENSNACKFFLKFVTGEYSVADFRFFVMVFNILLTRIYPSVDETLDDADLFNDFHVFTIHISYVRFVLKKLLPNYTATDNNLEEILKSAPNSTYPEMVSLWTVGDFLIGVFQKAHQSIHTILKNILFVIGWTGSEFISKENFYDFIRVVQPFKSKKEIKKIWASLKSECDEQVSAESIPRAHFTAFIGDAMNMMKTLFTIPDTSSFKRVINTLPVPISELFRFLVDRFLSWIPNVLERLDSDVLNKVKQSTAKLRNSLMRCDISTSLMYYNHMLQLIDLKLTERNPIIVITDDFSIKDSSRVQNLLKMREILAYQHIYMIDDEDEGILKDYVALEE